MLTINIINRNNVPDPTSALLGVSAIVMGILAYVVTAEDKPEGSK